MFQFFFKIFSIVLLLCFSNHSWSLNEEHVFNEIKESLLNDKKCDFAGKENESFWKVFSAPTKVSTYDKGKVPYSVYGSKFGCGLGKYGSLVIAPGRSEASIEFYETALDYIKEGFSPVYVIDHVGQGFSPRLLEDPNKGHIHKFEDYIIAFKDFVESVEQDLKVNEGRNEESLFFSSNSMGGAVGFGYFQMMGEQNPFKAAALFGPMIRINYLGFPGGLASVEDYPNGVMCPSFVQNLMGKESAVVLNAWVQQTFKHDYGTYATQIARDAAAKYGTAYVDGMRDFAASFAVAPEQVMTHSSERYDLKTFLWESKDMKEVYKGMGLIVPTLSAPTIQWTKEAASFNMAMRKKWAIKKMTNIPIAIITGSRDVRSYKPYKDCSHDLTYHTDYCDDINSIKGKGVCTFSEIEEAFHEIYKEEDFYRDQGIEKALKHFLK